MTSLRTTEVVKANAVFITHDPPHLSCDPFEETQP